MVETGKNSMAEKKEDSKKAGNHFSKGCLEGKKNLRIVKSNL